MTWFTKTKVLFRPADNTIVEEDNLKITEVEELLDICDEADDMDKNFYVEDEVIEIKQEACVSLAIFIPKKDGSKSFVIWPMPRIDDIFDQISVSKIFSALDLTQGYHQIELEKIKTIYRVYYANTSLSVYQYAFWIKNSSSSIQ
jgi:hypothetical protein